MSDLISKIWKLNLKRKLSFFKTWIKKKISFQNLKKKRLNFSFFNIINKLITLYLKLLVNKYMRF